MNDIFVSTYLRRQDEELVALSEFAGTPEDCEYIAGSIEIRVGYTVLLSRSVWDDVNWIWPLAMNAVEDFLNNGDGNFSFPDQPIDVRFGEAATQTVAIVVEVPGSDSMSGTCDRASFINGMCSACIEAMAVFQALCPENTEEFRREAARARRLSQKV